MNYPDEPAGPFEPPPRRFEDGEGRETVVREYGSHHGSERETDALTRMYREFSIEDRAQGIPPAGEERIRRWLAGILDGDNVNVVAWHGGRAVGHAMLADDGDAHEFASFVLEEYRDAGVGTYLLEALLGLGERAGVERVWLSVHRGNRPAIAIDEKVGFERADESGYELRMALRLAPDGT